MTNNQRDRVLTFLSDIAVSNPPYAISKNGNGLLSFYRLDGSAYRFGDKEDGRLAVDNDYWLVQSEDWKVKRLTGECEGDYQEQVDTLLFEWLVAALDTKCVDDALPAFGSVYGEMENNEIPEHWNKERWNEAND